MSAVNFVVAHLGQITGISTVTTTVHDLDLSGKIYSWSV